MCVVCVIIYSYSIYGIWVNSFRHGGPYSTQKNNVIIVFKIGHFLNELTILISIFIVNFLNVIAIAISPPHEY